MGLRLLAFSLLAALAWAPAAMAHGLDANRVELVLHEDVVEAVATPAAESVRVADEDGDGRITPDELRAHREEVRRALVDALSLTDGDGRPGTLERSDVSVPRGDLTDGVLARDYVRLTVKLRWPRPPSSLRLRCGFVGTHPLAVSAQRAEASGPGVLTLVGDPQGALLATRDAEASLFGPSAPAAVAPPPTSAPRPLPTSRAMNPAAVVLLTLAGLTVLLTTVEGRKTTS